MIFFPRGLLERCRRDPPVHIGISLAVLGACIFQVCSFDIFWHLEIGRIFWDTGRLIDRNLFSWTYPAHPWRPTYWLFEVLVYPLHRLAGAAGLILLRAGVLAGCWGLLARHFGRRGANPWLSIVVFLAAIDVSLFRFLVRPHIFSFLGLAILIVLLDRWRTAPYKACFLWELPLLFLFWANLHSGVVFGFAYFALFLAALGIEVVVAGTGGPLGRIARLFATPRLRRGALLLGVCLAACLVNPTGWGLFRYVYDHLTMDLVIPIEELAPFHPGRYPKTAFVLGWLILLPPLVSAAARKFLPGVWLRALFSVYLMSKGVRFVPVACLFSLPGVFAAEAVLRVRKNGGGARRPLPRHLRLPALHIVVPLLFVLHAHLQVYRLPESLFVSGLGFSQAAFPFKVAAKLPADLPRGLYNSFSVGGYLIWRSHQRVRVFQDGRIHAYPPAFFRRIEPLLSTSQGSRTLVTAFGVTRLVLRKQEDPILSSLAADDPEWRVIAEDANFLYAVRKADDIPAGTGLTRQREDDPGPR
ncbi:MAG: hypothetical protein GXP31_10305 [Kiritimatiellaeota bacterium]|nr:hypothetical protein [Kiritimatiellota bacterium]